MEKYTKLDESASYELRKKRLSVSLQRSLRLDDEATKRMRRHNRTDRGWKGDAK